jgi:hypothetical protein
MKKKFHIALIIGLVVLINLQCRKPYALPDSEENPNILVVEGIVNTGSDSTIIRLSRTVKLNDTTSSLPELQATVSLVEPSGAVFSAFGEKGNGYYAMPGFNNVNITDQIRLKIVTSAGKIYFSEVLTVKNSPPIDSVGFQVKSNGIELYSTTHDPTNNSRYYRWDYKEDWIIHSAYQSNLEVQTTPVDTIVARPLKDQIFVCWRNDVSSTIILNSSAALSQDIIAYNLIAFVGSNSEKLSNEYCITVNQYVLTKDAFNYWQNLKKNTEQLGSIFDAQPSEIAGNIHSADNPAEPVIGFITMGEPAQKRLFIGNSQLPMLWFQQVLTPYSNCPLDSLYFVDPANSNSNTTLLLYLGGAIPIDPILTPREVLIGYSASGAYCVDCRFRGTTTRPSFWIDKY